MGVNAHRRPLLWLRRLIKGDIFIYHGATIRLPSNTQSIMRWMVLRGDYEDDEWRVISDSLEPDVPTIELGGSLGIISAYIASRLSEGTPFVVVEANPEIFDICRTNATDSGKRGNVHLVNKVVAYDGKDVEFHISKNAHISGLASSEKLANSRLPAITLRDLLSTHRIDGEYILVSDIEGGEWDLPWRDAEALARCKVAVIELHPHIFANQNRSVNDFIERMADIGLQNVSSVNDTYKFVRS